MTIQAATAAEDTRSGLPLLALLALATTSFLVTLTEALPAGLLPQMGADLGVSDSWAGQLISVYAIGSLLAAIPLTTATRSWRRRRLLIMTLVGFAVANSVTAVFGNFGIILVARFLGGVSAGLLWALMTPYAVRMAPAQLSGRAMAIALAGIPVAMSIGIPAGTFIGIAFGWRTVFGLMTLIALLLIGWVLVKVPDFAGEQKGGQQLSLWKVILMPGILPVLVTILAYILAQNMLYTYIAPLLDTVGASGQTDRVLLTFGIVSLAGIAIVGATVDRALRLLIVADIGLFIVATLLLAFGAVSPLVVYGAAAIWGLAFGGASTIFQTALIRAAGPAADTAAAIIVTVWNIAIAGGAFGGGLILQNFGASALPWSLLVLLIPALGIALLNRAFSSHKTTPTVVRAH
ncbi:MFS transporter [Neorhizobium sp. P12A]|uniref:MFS transporter n=1 Tax=Neorhizobium sp. P12A TaxID=2268027 RepID=UPI0011EF6FCC|nr:MFS transporter [Neorhizobium sp. P12A]KAA0693331.1 MFS transporter [Neorhizobium sp. P12A]